MKKIGSLFYKHGGGHFVKKKYRDRNGFMPTTTIDASKLPDDLDLSKSVYFKIGLNSHSLNFPAFSLAVTIYDKTLGRNTTNYFCITHLSEAPLNVLKMCIETLKVYERDYYRALEEIGDEGNLLKDIS